jgi:hypothetical protein
MGTISDARVRAILAVISIATIAQLALPVGARAQVDLNIQSRIDSVAAPFQVHPIRPEAGSQGEPARCQNLSCFSDEQINARFEQFLKLRQLTTAAKKHGEFAPDMVNPRSLSIEKKRRLLATFFPPNVKPGPHGEPPTQPSTLKIMFPFIPLYETNATRSNIGALSDSSVSLGGGFQYTTQGFRNLDVIAFAGGSSSVRYARLSNKDFDNLTSSAAYQVFLGAYDKNGGWIDAAKGTNIPSGQITFNTLSFGVQNSTTLSPTFHAETVDLFTPNLVYGWQNVPLGNGLCAPLKPDVKPSDLSFCSSLDIAVTAGQTFSDQRSLQNASAALAANFNQKIDKTYYTVAFTSTFTAKTYENVLGGRNDFALQVGPKFSYNPSPNVSTSLWVTYNRNYSTLTAAEWHGWIIQPSLTVSFQAM